MAGKKEMWINAEALSEEEIQQSGFTQEELKLLSYYVTNPTGNVFCITGLQGIAGSVFARYSRAQGGFRETLLKEFLKEGKINAKKAGTLIERILVAYGDDSVGELEGMHLSLEQISNLATKIVEDCRIGGSPIEQSTRYVFYDNKDKQGNFKYLREKKIMTSQHASKYIDTMNFLFTTYCDLIEPMKAYFMKLKPLEEAEYDLNGKGAKRFADITDEEDKKAFKRTYEMDIRTKACDTIRVILPASTLTNVGLFGNGRFYQGLLTKLYTDTLSESNDLGELARKELDKVMPQFVKRAKTDEYQQRREQNMQKLAQEILGKIVPEQEKPVVLLDNQPTPTNIAAECLFKYS
ncbi:FAD-dependent thymidylate synthase, partial [Candidatus Woesearchaeota archaeon]|nr:FAD-dependent thymidylate synthase [Candidatus Woesearchaeota archaeon]